MISTVDDEMDCNKNACLITSLLPGKGFSPLDGKVCKKKIIEKVRNTKDPKLRHEK